MGGRWIHIWVGGYRWNRLDYPIFPSLPNLDWVKHSPHIVESCDESCLTDLLGCMKIVAALPTEPHSHYGASVHELCVYGLLHCWGYYETLCNGFCGKEKKYQKRTAKKSAADIIEVFTIDPPYNISDELYLVGQIKGKTAAVGKSTNWIKYMEHLLSIGERKIWKGEWVFFISSKYRSRACELNIAQQISEWIVLFF